MCGIAGYVNTRSAAATGGLAVLSRMTDVIQHRGPDDSGYFQDSGVFLGHRRLSIIDVSAGHQPMANEDGTVNGSSTTARSSTTPMFALDLERAGHVYTTHCDTETDHPRLRRIRAGLSGAFPRHVRIRNLGLDTSDGSSARATVSALSRSITIGTAACSRSLPRSRRCWSIPPSRPGLKKNCCRNISAFGYISEERTLFSGIRRLMPGHHLHPGSRRPRTVPLTSSVLGCARGRHRRIHERCRNGSPNAAGVSKKPSACA